jgi:coenzyme F420-reducing hydrogenase delta subunit
MAQHGEWNKKGATLSDETANKEYGVSREFIVAGINSGDLEYREGAIWGNPYLRILRSQLEKYIAKQLGANYLMIRKSQTELRKIKKEITDTRKKLTELEARKADIERLVCSNNSFQME